MTRPDRRLPQRRLEQTVASNLQGGGQDLAADELVEHVSESRHSGAVAIERGAVFGRGLGHIWATRE